MTGRLAAIGAASFLAALLLVSSGCGGGGTAPAEGAGDSGSGAAGPAVPAQPAGTAEITGTVTYDGKVPALRPIAMSGDPGCAAKHGGPVTSQSLVLGEGNTMANVLVSVKSGLPARAWPVPAQPAVLDQQGCLYSPHVMGIMAGQRLRILNSDGLLHNIHALPEVNKTFNIAMPANRTETEQTFDKPEAPFKIKCDVHPWMGAYVAVLDHPYHNVTAQDGKFSISGLPAGTYEIEAWHERLGTRSASATVADGERGVVDFAFAK